MKVVAAVVCVALGTAWVLPARAEEVRPTFERLELGADAAETYRLNALTIVHEGMSGGPGTIYVGRETWWRPVRGKFRWATSYDDFYLKVGRNDLGEQHRHRRMVSNVFFWSGLLLGLGGLVVVLTEIVPDHKTRFGIALGLIGGGVVLTAIGSRSEPPLISEEDAAAMANEYNRRLQIHLGLPPMAPNAGGAYRPPIGFTLSRRW
jgi:hypothetical protein